MNTQQVKANIDQVVVDNTSGNITASAMNGVLKNIVDNSDYIKDISGKADVNHSHYEISRAGSYVNVGTAGAIGINSDDKQITVSCGGIVCDGNIYTDGNLEANNFESGNFSESGFYNSGTHAYGFWQRVGNVCHLFIREAETPYDWQEVYYRLPFAVDSVYVNLHNLGPLNKYNGMDFGTFFVTENNYPALKLEHFVNGSHQNWFQEKVAFELVYKIAQ